MTREELGQAVSQAVWGYMSRALGFPFEVPTDPIHAVFANFLVLRFYSAATMVLDGVGPERQPFFFGLLGKGMAWATQVERLPWTEAAHLWRSLADAGLPSALPDFPRELGPWSGPEAFGAFWEEYGPNVILQAVVKADPQAAALVERPPYVLLPTGWVEVEAAVQTLEAALARPGRRAKASVRLALNVFKVAPPAPALVDVAFRFLRPLRSLEVEP